MGKIWYVSFTVALPILVLAAADDKAAREYQSCGYQNSNDAFISELQSPTYTTSNNISSYPPNQNCSWSIRFPYKYINRVRLDFSEVDLYQDGSGCETDWIRYTYPGQPPGLHVWCDITHMDNSTILNNTDQVILQFQSGNISDDVNDGKGKGKGFKLQYRAECDESHEYHIDGNETSISPPPRNSSLADCKYRWRLKEPQPLGEQKLLLVRVIPSTNEWKVQERPVLAPGICLPYHNITITFSPSLGSQPQETQLSFQRAKENECGCLLESKVCQNGGTCIESAGTFVCRCESRYEGVMCESKIVTTEMDSAHCIDGADTYLESNINWRRTKMGQTDTQPCPNATGNATRPCLSFDSHAEWGQPDLSGCVSKLFSDIYNEAKLLLHAEYIDQSSIVNITSALLSATTMTTDKRLYAGDLNAATSTLEKVADIVGKAAVDNDGLSSIATGFGNAVGNIVDPRTSTVWRFACKGYLENRVTSLLASMEILSANIAAKATEILSRKRWRLTNNNLARSFSVTSINLDFKVTIIGRNSDQGTLGFNGQTGASEIILPRAVFGTAVHGSSESYLHIYNAKFTSISELIRLTKQLNDNVENSSVPLINSDILSGKILNVDENAFTSLTDPVKLVFRLQNSTLSRMFQQQCVFLNMSATAVEERWLKQGCWKSEAESNDSMTICYCNHLTNFAVLMDIYGVQGSIDKLNSKVLTYLSYGGGTLSVLGCVLSIIVFEFFRLKNERVRIHEQLAVTIILVQTFFLVGIDRTENRSVCMAMAICLHYFLMAMFCWMLVEGVHLYLMLVKVFQSGSHMKKYIAIGWGVPIVVVGISAGIFHEDYGAGSICWLTKEVLLIAFVPAVCLVIVINTVVLLVVMRIMMTSLSKGSKSYSEDKSSVRIGLKAAAVLLPLLGLTWTFGFLSITSEETLIFTYLFTLFNSMQGVFFFVFHCLLSVDVQNAYDRRNRRLSHLRLTESSISKQHSRKSSESGDLSKRSTLISEIASTLERRRSHTNSYSSFGQPQSVTFDDDVFLTEDGPKSRNSFHSNRSSTHSNRSGQSFNDIMKSSPMPHYESIQGYRNNILNNSAKSNGSVSSDGYLFYYGKDKKALTETALHDLDKNQLYATVNK